MFEEFPSLYDSELEFSQRENKADHSPLSGSNLSGNNNPTYKRDSVMELCWICVVEDWLLSVNTLN